MEACLCYRRNPVCAAHSTWEAGNKPWLRDESLSSLEAGCPSPVLSFTVKKSEGTASSVHASKRRTILPFASLSSTRAVGGIKHLTTGAQKGAKEKAVGPLLSQTGVV